MMKISCNGSGKRFNRDWIFRHFTYEFNNAGRYAIIGPNGSGKSTLLQVIAGAIVASEGTIAYQSPDSRQMDADNIYARIAIAAPYLEVIEEMTFIELLRFHNIFKPFLPGIKVDEIVARVGMQPAADKQIRYYSSGMKQRVKLAQAIFSDSSCLLLDEPCTNLDDKGIQLYHQLIEDYGKNRLIIVSSNDVQEYSFCDKEVSILAYK
jgi:ABC-type multidrug transport system ATPase subunit